MNSDPSNVTALLERTPFAVAQRCQELLAPWKRETAFLSSSTQRAMHPAYQGIIGLGPRVVPLLIEELQREPCDLFWALKAITGEDPVSADDRGHVQRMAAAWLTWGRQRGIAT